MRKLNLGCGFDHREGWVNADNFSKCSPDVLMDVEAPPWPFKDNEFDHILMKHVLEHVGADFNEFKQVMQELYRVAKPDGLIEIQVPHFRHDTFWSDPTHVRGFTLLTFVMMSKARNDDWIARRANYTMVAYLMEVDFEIAQASIVYDPRWLERESRGEVTREQLRIWSGEHWNVAKELHVTLKAKKPFSR
jgi:ubiquinone/menaquinone biosynthesis C-methylase UbiE